MEPSVDFPEIGQLGVEFESLENNTSPEVQDERYNPKSYISIYINRGIWLTVDAPA